ncbi:MAG: HEPN domain-containing protein [Phycisphaerales bacterium]
MGTQPSNLWLDVARSNQQAAALLHEGGDWRSSISRSWYCCVAAAHAFLIHAGQTPPTRGNWDNTDLKDHLARVLTSRERGRQAPLAEFLWKRMDDVWRHRLFADYDPTASAAVEAARDSVDTATRLVGLASKEMQR